MKINKVFTVRRYVLEPSIEVRLCNPHPDCEGMVVVVSSLSGNELCRAPFSRSGIKELRRQTGYPIPFIF